MVKVSPVTGADRRQSDRGPGRRQAGTDRIAAEEKAIAAEAHLTLHGDRLGLPVKCSPMSARLSCGRPPVICGRRSGLCGEVR